MVSHPPGRGTRPIQNVSPHGRGSRFRRRTLQAQPDLVVPETIVGVGLLNMSLPNHGTAFALSERVVPGLEWLIPSSVETRVDALDARGSDLWREHPEGKGPRV